MDHPHSRTSDPHTSYEAGDSVDRGTIRRNVLALFEQFPCMTDECLSQRYWDRYGPLPESSARKRRCELTQDGFIRDSGTRERLSTGRKGIVWQYVQPGERMKANNFNWDEIARDDDP